MPESEFQIGDLVVVTIYGAGPAINPPVLGHVNGTMFNAGFGFDYDVQINEEEREEARDFLNECEAELGDHVAGDHWLLRNCQPWELRLVSRPYTLDLALEALGQAIDEARRLDPNSERNWTIKRLLQIESQILERCDA